MKKLKDHLFLKGIRFVLFPKITCNDFDCCFSTSYLFKNAPLIKSIFVFKKFQLKFELLINLKSFLLK